MANEYDREYYIDPYTGQRVARTNDSYTIAGTDTQVRDDQSTPQYDQETGSWYTVDQYGQTRPVEAPGQSANAVGGSLGASGLIIGDLQGQGQSDFDLYSGFADSAQAQQAGYGTAAQGIGQDAFQAGSDVTGQLDYNRTLLKQQIGSIPNNYGDASTMTKWQNATAAGSTFDPSAASKSTAAGLANFNAGSTAGQLTDSYDALTGYANQGPGPSAAEAQLQSSLGKNVASQFAMANSGRNAGANAMAARNAGFTAADMSQKTAAELATLRATEEAAWRNQQLSALSSASNVAGAIDSSGINRNAQELSGLTSAANLYANQDTTGLAARQYGATQYGNQYNAQASTQQAANQDKLAALAQLDSQQNQLHTQTAGNYGQLTAANTAASDMAARGSSTALQAYGAGTAAKMGYNASALDIYTGNANRAAASASQDKGIAASEYAASQLANERNTDRAIGAAGAAASVIASTAGSE